MANISERHMNPYYSKTSAKKVALSLMWNTYQNHTISIIENSITHGLPYNQVQTPQTQIYVESEALIIKKFEEQIDKLNKKMEEANNALNQIELCIIDLTKPSETDFDNPIKAELSLYSILKDWLLKQITIRIDGLDIQGILTEVSSGYITLILSEYIIIIPLNKIDFIKLPG